MRSSSWKSFGDAVEVDDDDDGVGDLASPFDDDEGDVDESKYGRLQAYLMYWMRSRLRLCASF